MITNEKWLNVFKPAFKEKWYHELYDKVRADYDTGRMVEMTDDIFKALNDTDFDNIKVVFIGSCPSGNLAERSPIMFSKSNDLVSCSSRNFRQEIIDEYCLEKEPPEDLSYLLEQGVLLTYSSLTARIENKYAHEELWRPFIEHMLKALHSRGKACIYVFLGRRLSKLSSCISETHNQKIICLPHPSPLSYFKGFAESGVFKKINEFLLSCGETPINWS